MLKQKEAKKKGTGCFAFVMFGLPIIIFLFVLIISLLYYSIATYNKCQKLDNQINKSWVNLEDAYKKRLDLIPDILNTVKAYEEHERTTLLRVSQARDNLATVNIDTENLREENIKIFENAQNQVSGSLSSLLASIENSTTLNADKKLLDIQNELKHIETDIIIKQDTFNSLVKDYNIYILKFPRNIFAKIYGYSTKGYFKEKE